MTTALIRGVLQRAIRRRNSAFALVLRIGGNMQGSTLRVARASDEIARTNVSPLTLVSRLEGGRSVTDIEIRRYLAKVVEMGLLSGLHRLKKV
jgi:hypothetical protein